MECPNCGKKVITIDYPLPIQYHNEDTEWGIKPTGLNHPTNPGDPGWLVAKRGALPAAICGT